MNNYINNQNFVIKILSDNDIKFIGQQLILKIHVVAKDQLLGLACRNGCYIINLDDHSGNGTHWVALYIKNNQAVYFDSYAENYPLDVYEFVHRNNNIDLIRNNIQLQHLDSNVCGWWCIYFLHYMDNSNVNTHVHDNIRKFNNQFNQYQLKANEKKLFNEIKKISKHII